MFCSHERRQLVWIATFFFWVLTAPILSGCGSEFCSRHSDCSIGAVCGPRGYCILAPDANTLGDDASLADAQVADAQIADASTEEVPDGQSSDAQSDAASESL